MFIIVFVRRKLSVMDILINFKRLRFFFLMLLYTECTDMLQRQRKLRLYPPMLQITFRRRFPPEGLGAIVSCILH
jgi:hypothetical protein